MQIQTQITTVVKVEKVIIPKIIKRIKEYWTAEQLITLVTMYNNKKSYDDISKAIGKSNLACRSKICRL